MLGKALINAAFAVLRKIDGLGEAEVAVASYILSVITHGGLRLHSVQI
jgi:hypothetical protein